MYVRMHRLEGGCFPGGLTVSCHPISAPEETAFLFDEIFCKQVYNSHGILLKKGPLHTYIMFNRNATERYANAHANVHTYIDKYIYTCIHTKIFLSMFFAFFNSVSAYIEECG